MIVFAAHTAGTIATSSHGQCFHIDFVLHRRSIYRARNVVLSLSPAKHPYDKSTKAFQNINESSDLFKHITYRRRTGMCYHVDHIIRWTCPGCQRAPCHRLGQARLWCEAPRRPHFRTPAGHLCPRRWNNQPTDAVASEEWRAPWPQGALPADQDFCRTCQAILPRMRAFLRSMQVNHMRGLFPPWTKDDPTPDVNDVRGYQQQIGAVGVVRADAWWRTRVRNGLAWTEYQCGPGGSARY